MKQKFYDKLLPLLGFDISAKEYTEVPEHEYKIVEYHNKNMSIGFVNRREAYKNEKLSRRKAGALHHLAFRAGSPEEVDLLYGKVKDLPTVIVHPPKYYPEYKLNRKGNIYELRTIRIYGIIRYTIHFRLNSPNKKHKSKNFPFYNDNRRDNFNRGGFPTHFLGSLQLGRCDYRRPSDKLSSLCQREKGGVSRCTPHYPPCSYRTAYIGLYFLLGS